MQIKSLGVMLVLTLLGAPVLWAHDHRAVATKYIFVVGFATEPAFAGQMNGVDLRVTLMVDDSPVEGVEKDLRVSIFKKDNKASIVLPLKPKYKEPGRYASYFQPTEKGTYIFVFQGKINGITINEKFESNKDKFHDVEDGVKFP
jgi:hypothetical protein